MTGDQLRELVLNNRNYEQLITLQPGVSVGGTSDQLYLGGSFPTSLAGGVVQTPLSEPKAAYQPNQVLFSIDGNRPTANNWTIDGADNVDRAANLTTLTYPSVDAISEFVTLRGTYEAEYGRSAGGQINVITRSGSNAFHGDFYEYFRNNILNANSYTNKVATPLLSGPYFATTTSAVPSAARSLFPMSTTARTRPSSFILRRFAAK